MIIVLVVVYVDSLFINIIVIIINMLLLPMFEGREWGGGTDGVVGH